ELQQAQQAGQNRLKASIAELERTRDQETQKIDRQLNLKIEGMRAVYKAFVVGIPPLLPLGLGIIVLIRRLTFERVSVPPDRKAG
ncbi:MAG TPA: hypothetical protein VG711_01925, partial [Phycisphaerales bacterium]|nr:hypothetical protein [Phycisphaerales bacterium]